jgi:hypothetical protein
MVVLQHKLKFLGSKIRRNVPMYITQTYSILQPRDQFIQIVDQAYEIQFLAKELEQFKCTLSDKFVAGDIIAKLPPSWKNFATFLKHKRQEFSVSDLIGSLHVEEKARAEDTRARDFDGSSSAHVVQKNNFQSHKSKFGVSNVVTELYIMEQFYDYKTTTDGITSTDDSFPDKDFFSDISGLYIDDMAKDAGANA